MSVPPRGEVKRAFKSAPEIAICKWCLSGTNATLPIDSNGN